MVPIPAGRSRPAALGFTLLAALAGLVLGAAGAAAQPSDHNVESGRGFSAYDTTTSETTSLGDGRSLLHIHSWGLFFTDNAASRLNQTRYDCFGSHLLGSDGASQRGHGYCVGTAASGDLWWIRWDGTLKGGDWRFVDGTGQFAEISGGGEWRAEAGFAPEETITVFEGSWRWAK